MRRAVFGSTRLLIGKRWKEKLVSYEWIKFQFRACFEMRKNWVVSDEGCSKGERHLSGGGIRKWSPQTPQLLSRDRSIPFLFAPYQFPRRGRLKKRAPEYSVVEHRWLPPARHHSFQHCPISALYHCHERDANLKYTQNYKKKEIILRLVIDRWTTPTRIDGIPSPLL